MSEPVDPQQPGTVTGYTLNTPEQVALVNRSKELENELGDFLHGTVRAAPGVDAALIDDACRHLRMGFMLANRAVFHPESRL